MRVLGGLGRRFAWLWAAYAVSTYGTWLGFGAFSFIAITVLHASAVEVSTMSAAGLVAGALLAVPLGPWIESRHKRPVMIGMDVARFAAQVSIPAAYLLGVLSIAQLVCVSIVMSAATIAFTSASGAYLKALVTSEQLLTANARFESTMWSASVTGPTLGGAAIGLFGPVVTIAADAVSYLLSALGIRAIGGTETVAEPTRQDRVTWSALAEGWRVIHRRVALRRLFLNSITVNGLIMAGEAPLAVLMLGQLGFPAWQYGLAFAVPCTGGLIGSRLARPLAARYGADAVLRIVGPLRCVWPIGLTFIGRGAAGLITVIGLEFALIVCCSIFGPLSATYRLRATGHAHVSRMLTAWSITSNVIRAVLILAWGALATAANPRWALAGAGLALLLIPVLLPLRRIDTNANPMAGEMRNRRPTKAPA